jgi:hypothetical protein
MIERRGSPRLRRDASADGLTRRSGLGRSRFGDFVLVVFLAAQVLDGAFTYVGIKTGVASELNPVLAWYMAVFGVGPTLAGAKLFAGGCGIALHVGNLHYVIAGLTLFYAFNAILPWTSLLFG